MRNWQVKARDIQTIGIKKLFYSKKKPVKTQDVRQIWAKNLAEMVKGI